MADLPIGEAIRKVRKLRGLYQCELGKRLGIYRQHVCRAERGHRIMNMDTFDRYAVALDISPWELMQVACELRKRLETQPIENVRLYL